MFHPPSLIHYGSSNFIRNFFLFLYSKMKLSTIFNFELTNTTYFLKPDFGEIGGMPAELQ